MDCEEEGEAVWRGRGSYLAVRGALLFLAFYIDILRYIYFEEKISEDFKRLSVDNYSW